MARTTAGSGYTRGQHSFAQIPSANIERSVFNRSYSLKTTFDAGYLIPIYVDEALPGDTFSMRVTAFTRLATPIFPILDNLYQDYFFFAVPYRLVWNNWKRFMGEQTSPSDVITNLVIPQMTEGPAILAESLSDYLGLPIQVGTNLTFNSLHHRAYNLIFNEWFRDENLQNPAVVDLGDGPDTPANYVIRRRGKRHDYFTSALPFPQKGAAVTLPLGTSAPVTISPLGDAEPTIQSGASGARKIITLGPATTPLNISGAGAAAGNWGWVDPKLQGTANLSAATAATINSIRQAFQIQRLLERDARGGSRYTEIVRSHFGVISPDARLQRPEYLGGGSTRINVHPVARTTSAGGSGVGLPPNAELGAFGTSSIEGVGFHKSFTEHCLLLGLVNVRADLGYQQGIERMFSRRTRFDYYWPALSHLGEQSIINREIFATGVGDPVLLTGDYATFGYQERYAEYRYKPSMITGKMRSTYALTMDQWHLAQKFASLPVLNNVFIEDNPPIDRVVGVPTQPDMFGDFWFEYKCARPMPTFSVPGLIDHF